MTPSSRRLAVSPRERADRARKLEQKLLQTWVEGVKTRSMLAIANDDRMLRKHFFGEQEWAGFTLVSKALLFRTALCLTSLWDDPGDNRASFPTVMELISCPEVLVVLRRDAFERLSPSGGRFRRKSALNAGRILRRALQSYEALRTDPDHREQLRRLRRQRNEHLAHALVGLEPETGPRYGWFERLEQQSGQIVKDIHLGLTGEADLDEHEAESMQNAKIFWSAAQRGMSEIRRERDQPEPITATWI